MHHTTKTLQLASAAILIVSIFASFANAADVPANLGGGLKNLTEQYRTMAPEARRAGLNVSQLTALRQQFPHVTFDATQRALVNIYFDGSVPSTTLKQQLGLMGLTIVGEAAWYRHGVVSAWLPLSQA